MWNDPAWVQWQIEHQKIGNPEGYTIWLMRRMTILMRVNVLSAMEAFSRALISASESIKRIQLVFNQKPSLIN